MVGVVGTQPTRNSDCLFGEAPFRPQIIQKQYGHGAVDIEYDIASYVVNNKTC